jgi:predicted TIM-barrel fold metal-dependent hydrolase
VYADEYLRPWYEAVVALVPHYRPFDAHTHTGSNDPDGYRSSVEQLTEALDVIHSRAAVFTMHEPGGYPPANDRVIQEAADSDGQLVPFCRLDPHSGDAAAEAERCLDAGARGIKLHPRAEQFRLEEGLTEPIFAVAHERGVPVLIHAGRGIPALGRDAVDLCERFPRAKLILAHAAVCDLAWIWSEAASHPNLFFDTAWWNATDLLTLFSLVPPGQVLWGSDAPYGTPLQSTLLAFRCGLQAGVSPEALATVGGEQMRRLCDGEPPLDLGPAPGDGPRLHVHVLLERVNSYLQTAVGRLILREGAEEYLELARLACEVGDDSPHAPVTRSVLALLDRFDRYQSDRPQELASGEGETRFPGLHLVVTAATVALTPDVPLPAEPEAVAAGERSA